MNILLVLYQNSIFIIVKIYIYIFPFMKKFRTLTIRMSTGHHKKKKLIL